MIAFTSGLLHIAIRFVGASLVFALLESAEAVDLGVENDFVAGFLHAPSPRAEASLAGVRRTEQPLRSCRP